jgi:signal transduction histidine kinase
MTKVLHNLKLAIEETGAEILFENLPEIIADEGQMIQLLQNLISNAIKFSTGKPVINVTAKKGKDYFLFCVSDEGIGIESQYFEKIFKIFQQLEPYHYKGTGIGLSICKRIVERHGGRIWVESEPDKGSQFYFLIPENADIFTLRDSLAGKPFDY